MLKFNSYRAKRYLRSRFVEGKYLLASEASDIELELIEALRRSVESTLGSEVAIEDAWEVSKLSATQLLVKPGEAWFKGLPVNFRSGKDQLVSGAILSEGIVPVGVSFADDASGLGKVITFNNTATTPTNLYKINVTIREELLTEVDDPFLQNANLTESTAQKVRLIFQINVVPDSLQTESPIPYRDEASTAGSPTNFPNTGGSAAPNLVNRIVVTPTAAGNGELISLTPITGSEKIDGRDLEIVIRNDSGIGGGIILPNSPTAQLAFSNGALIDSYGNRYHVNQIFNDTISTQLVIRIDKEPDQPNPQLVNTLPYSLEKRDVYVTDDVNGSPQGKQYWDIATVNWHQTNGFVHQSSVTDLRTVVKKQDEFQEKSNNKDVLTLLNTNTISWNSATSLLTWADAFKFVNPSGPDQTISAGSAPLVDGGSLVYDLKLAAGGALEKGTLAINVTAFGATSSLSAVDLSTIKLGNVVIDSAGFVTYITAIDDVNNTITTDIALTANGAATIYKDSYGPQYAPISVDSAVLAVRNSNKVYLSGLELENGETGAIGDGVSTQLLAYIGAPDETTSSPTYSSTISISSGDSHTVAIGKLDAAVGVTSAGVNQDRTMKLIAGGTWSWTLGTNTLAWSANAFIQIAGLADSVNQIDTGSAIIAAGEVAYVDVSRVGPGGSLTVQIADIASVTPDVNRIIIARRDDNDIIVGNHSMRLSDGESKKLYAGLSDQYSLAINQDRNLNLIEGGNWSLSTDGTTITWDADAYIQVPGLPKERNTIPAGSWNFVGGYGQIAYVNIHRDSGANDNLTVVIDSIISFTPSIDKVIIGTRTVTNNATILGKPEFLLRPLQSRKLLDSHPALDSILINSSMTVSHNKIYLVDSSVGPLTLTLPFPIDDSYIEIKDTGSASSNNITVLAGFLALMDGQSSVVISSDNASFRFVCKSGNWYIV